MSSFKRVKDSETEFAELMVPSYANFGNKVHGGVLLSIMDKVAYATAVKHCKGYVVTASVDLVEFIKPIELGNLLALKSKVNYVGKTSMIVGIRVESTNIKSGEVLHTNTAFFTMVMTPDDDHVQRDVPGLILENNEDKRRFAEGLHMKMLAKEKRNLLRGDLSNMTQLEIQNFIQAERCQFRK